MIKVKNISKSFGRIKAVNNLSFEVKSGEIVGLLGPNGAGKTTTMRMLTSYLLPDKGSIKINGKDISENPEEIKRKIGYMPESNPLYKDLLVKEFIDFILKIRDVPNYERDDLIEKTVKSTGIGEIYYRPIGELSKGFKQRVGLAQAILHDPEILILDEPTEGLDPNQRTSIRKLIKEIGKTKTIILSTHVMQEVSAMCNRVIIIDKGALIADSPTNELEKMKKGYSEIQLITVGKSITNKIKKLEGVKEVDSSEIDSGKKEYIIQYENADNIFKDLSKLVIENELIIYKLNEKSTSLEDIFYELTSK